MSSKLDGPGSSSDQPIDVGGDRGGAGLVNVVALRLLGGL